jgi:hypothetical protein
LAFACRKRARIRGFLPASLLICADPLLSKTCESLLLVAGVVRTISEAFTLIGGRLPPVRDPLALVRDPLALVRDPLALVCHLLPLISHPVPLVRHLPLALIRHPPGLRWPSTVAFAPEPRAVTLECFVIGFQLRRPALCTGH